MGKTPVAFVFLMLSGLCLAAPPNIVLVLTDDQGYGDLGCHGNPHVRTPAIDAFAGESVEFTRFYVSPVCAPTRASLMTGRYHYRTGVTDTWFGRATMHPDETTLAEVLKGAGYATGLFGKWHLGDTCPHRPQDQGFDEVLMHRGGGISQPSCPPGNSYSDPVLLHGGEEKTFPGYCMDVYTDAALAFIDRCRKRPFFALLATNTPDTPLQVPERYERPYLQMGLPEETSRIYGMVANIDDNFARVLEKLEALSLAKNTIVIFMSDNGPRVFAEQRHLAGLNGAKTDVYEGGIRSPFFLRWPRLVQESKQVERLAAHIDLMPTLLDACGIAAPSGRLDGRSLLPLLEDPQSEWPDRSLFLQWHRGNVPTAYRNFAMVGQRFKLLQRANKYETSNPRTFELYDLENDPGETRNLAEEKPEMVARMREAYDQWFKEVGAERGYPETPSWIGSPRENPVVLTQQDRRDASFWGDDTHYEDAYWPVRILEERRYRVALELFSPAPVDGVSVLRLGAREFRTRVSQGEQRVTFPLARLEPGAVHLSAWLEVGPERTAPQFVEVSCRED